RSIVALPAGSCFTVEADGRRSIRQFYSIGKRLAAFEETAKSAFDANELLVTVRDTIANSVKAHLVADVPVAVYLSAGMDSATIAGLASEQAPETLRSVTLGFEEYRGTINDETVHAQLLAECYNTDHTVRWYSRDEFEGHVQSIVAAMDQPSTDGLNTYFVSKAARSCGVKTALSGLGGDELFGTYPSFRDIPRMTRLLGGKPVASAGRVFRLLSCPLVSQFTSTKYAGLFEYGGTYAGAYLLRRALFMPWELKGILPREILREGWERLAPLERLSETVADIKSPHLKISALEMSWYMRNQLLRDSDWAGMANSIEIRVPLVDISVLGALSSLLGRPEMKGKQFLKDVPEKPIPEAVVTRRKTGFAVPIHEWNLPRYAGLTRRNLSTGLRDWALRLAKEFDLIG